MLINIHKAKWVDGFKIENEETLSKSNVGAMEKIASLTEEYNKWIQEELKKSKKELNIANVGKINPGIQLKNQIEEEMNSNIIQSLTSMINTIIF